MNMLASGGMWRTLYLDIWLPESKSGVRGAGVPSGTLLVTGPRGVFWLNRHDE